MSDFTAPCGDPRCLICRRAFPSIFPAERRREAEERWSRLRARLNPLPPDQQEGEHRG